MKRGGGNRPLTVDLNRDRYHKLVAKKGWWTQTQQAEALGLSQAAISRMVAPEGRPSSKSIAALLVAFPEETFDSLFEIVEDLPLRRVAA